MWIKVFFLVCFICLTKTQIIRRGTCPSVNVKQDFDIDKYLGKWYEYERSFAFFEYGLDCVTNEYSKREDGNITILNKGVLRAYGEVDSVLGTARPANSSDVGKLLFKFESLPFELDYWVLDTDYTTYAIVFNCVDLVLAHTENLWILSRQPQLPTDIVEKIYNQLYESNVYTNELRTVKQNCTETTVS